ncbi:hypothetical protein, partial [Nitrosomonas sp.]|uniref:hypothetical protein n=1 Tax=Nitrosomonas sp. TaxID=42353 RepID=UPI00374D8402
LPGYESAHLGAGFYLPEESCCQNSILGDKKVHVQRNWVCACLPVNLLCISITVGMWFQREPVVFLILLSTTKKSSIVFLDPIFSHSK